MKTTVAAIESAAAALWSFDAPALHDDYPIEEGWRELTDSNTRERYRARSRAALYAAEMSGK